MIRRQGRIFLFFLINNFILQYIKWVIINSTDDFDKFAFLIAAKCSKTGCFNLNYFSYLVYFSWFINTFFVKGKKFFYVNICLTSFDAADLLQLFQNLRFSLLSLLIKAYSPKHTQVQCTDCIRAIRYFYRFLHFRTSSASIALCLRYDIFIIYYKQDLTVTYTIF